MSNLQHITSKIKKDSEVQRDNIIASANEQAKLIIDRKESAAKKDAADLIERSRKDSKIRKERILSSATLKVRNDKLVAKQEIIGEVFLKAKRELDSMSDDKFKDFVKNRILNLNLIGDESIVVTSDKKNLLVGEFIVEINNQLKANNKKGELKISEEDGNFSGGFIIKKNGVELNNTFESLVNSLVEEMEFEIANTIFN